MSLVVEADASDDWDIVGRQRAKQFAYSLGLPGGLRVQRVVTVQNLDLQLALSSQFGDFVYFATAQYRLSKAYLTAAWRLVAHEAIPGYRT